MRFIIRQQDNTRYEAGRDRYDGIFQDYLFDSALEVIPYGGVAPDSIHTVEFTEGGDVLILLKQGFMAIQQIIDWHDGEGGQIEPMVSIVPIGFEEGEDVKCDSHGRPFWVASVIPQRLPLQEPPDYSDRKIKIGWSKSEVKR